MGASALVTCGPRGFGVAVVHLSKKSEYGFFSPWNG